MFASAREAYLCGEPYTNLYDPPAPRLPTHRHRDRDCRLVIAACREIQRRHIDMTADYTDWIKIGFALASLGETGRQCFHAVSSQNPGYDPRQTDRVFNSLTHPRGITLGTFFAYCRQYRV